MTENEFETLMAQVMTKLEDGSGSHLDVLSNIAQKHTAIEEFGQIVGDIAESLRFIRLALKYMAFDLEATRRERDQLKMILEDQDS